MFGGEEVRIIVTLVFEITEGVLDIQRTSSDAMLIQGDIEDTPILLKEISNAFGKIVDNAVKELRKDYGVRPKIVLVSHNLLKL